MNDNLSSLLFAWTFPTNFLFKWLLVVNNRAIIFFVFFCWNEMKLVNEREKKIYIDKRAFRLYRGHRIPQYVHIFMPLVV